MYVCFLRLLIWISKNTIGPGLHQDFLTTSTVFVPFQPGLDKQALEASRVSWGDSDADTAAGGRKCTEPSVAFCELWISGYAGCTQCLLYV